MTRVYWERLEAGNLPPVGELVLVYGYRSPDDSPALGSGPFGPEVGVDVIRNGKDFDEFDAVSHWARLDDIDTPEPE